VANGHLGHIIALLNNDDHDDHESICKVK